MSKEKITFIINNTTYSLHANDSAAIRQMPKADRQQLIDLLDAVKQQDRLAQIAVQSAASTAKQATQTTTNAIDSIANQTVKSERLSSGDIDDLMTRLAQEEKRNKKPEMTKQTIYKWVAGIAITIMVLILII